MRKLLKSHPDRAKAEDRDRIFETHGIRIIHYCNCHRCNEEPDRVGASWWDRTVTAEIRAVFENQPTPSATIAEVLSHPLTRREQKILALIAAGKSDREIAQLLQMTIGTARVHVHAILQKLEVRDRT